MAHKNGVAKLAKLPLDVIRLGAGTQTRAHIDDATVAEYAEAMARGDRFPPVVVFQNDGEFIMADGFHRHKAAHRTRLKHLLAEIRQGSHKDALRFALGANHEHGLRRSNGDKRRAVEIALAEFGNQSDRLLGQLCGVSQTFVGNIRHQLSTVYSSTPRLGRDGKVRALPVQSITGPPRAGKDVNPARARQDAEGYGGSNGDAGNEAFIELADALAGVEEMAEKLVNDEPDKMEAVLAMIGKLRTDLLQLEKRLRQK